MARAMTAVLAAALVLPGAGARAQDSDYNKAILGDGPLFYWTFDEPGDQDDAVNLVDPSNPLDNLAAQGATTRAAQGAIDGDIELGRAADFDGQNGTRFYTGDLNGSTTNPDPQPGVDFLPSGLWVLEMWFQSTGDPDRGQYMLEGIQTHPGTVSNNPAVILDYTQPNYLEIFGGGSRTAAAGPTIDDTNWHHLVIACYGSGFTGVADRRDLILDGNVLTFRGEIPQAFTFALGQLGVGATAWDGTGGFQGNIDELAVYDLGARLVEGGVDITIPNIEAEDAMAAIVLDIADHFNIAADVGYGDAVLADEPFLYWNFDEAGDKDPAGNKAAGAVASDDLVAQGNSTRVNHGDLGDGLLLGRAASFDGQNGSRFFAADLKGTTPGPGIDFVPSQLWAFETWFKLKGANDGFRGDYLLESWAATANDPGLIYDFNFGGGQDYLELFRGERTKDAGPSVSDEAWHHLIFAFYGNSGGFGVANRRDIILDGRFYSERASAFSSGFGLVQIALGNTVAGGGVNGFEGYIDEVALYDVGAKLAAGGIDISVQSEAGEAAFEAFLRDIADHRLLVSFACEEQIDSVTIEGPDTGSIGDPVTLTAAFAGADAGGTVTYAWSVSPADAILVDNGDGTVTVDAAGPGTVTVKVEADDGACAEPGTAVKASKSLCFETADAVVIDGHNDVVLGGKVDLAAIFAGADPVSYLGPSNFSSGFALVEYAVGNTVFGGGVNGFEGRMDEMAIYDVGTKLLDQGIDLSTQNAAAEAAFEEFVQGLAAHAGEAKVDGYNDLVLGGEPILYWSFDEGDVDPAVNLAVPESADDQLLPNGTATRVDHDTLGDGLLLGRAAQFDGTNGCRFYAADLKGPEQGPGTLYIASQLWAIEFWFQVTGDNAGGRADYFVESVGAGATNNPGLIYDFTADDYIELFGPGGRTGSAGPRVSDGKWHHIVMAFFGNTGGFGAANRREIILDGGLVRSYSWSLVSGDASLVDLGDGLAEVTPNAAGTVVVKVDVGDGACGDGASAEHTITVTTGGGGGLRMPGDINEDSKLDLSDPIALLGHLFLGERPVLPCDGGTKEDPGNKTLLDVNGDTGVDLSDAIYTLNYLFLGGTAPVLGKECVEMVGCSEKCER